MTANTDDELRISSVPPVPGTNRYEYKSPPPRTSIVDPGISLTATAEMLIDFAGTPPAVMSTPVGSIQFVPFASSPNGIVSVAPVIGSTAETDVTLVDPSVSCCATGTPVPEIKSTGEVPLPSQPRLIVPIGARRVPS